MMTRKMHQHGSFPSLSRTIGFCNVAPFEEKRRKKQWRKKGNEKKRIIGKVLKYCKKEMLIFRQNKKKNTVKKGKGKKH